MSWQESCLEIPENRKRYEGRTFSCLICGHKGGIEDFYLKNKARCKECTHVRNKAWYSKNRDKRRKAIDRWAASYKPIPARKEQIRTRFRERARRVYKTLRGNALMLWSSMRKRPGKERGYDLIKLEVTKQEFYQWLKDTNHKEKFEAWENSGFQSKLAPTIDRIDNLGHYTLSNMQILTKSEHAIKSHLDRKKKAFKDITGGGGNDKSTREEKGNGS